MPHTSSSSRLLVYLCFLVGPGPLHEIAVSAFGVVHWAVRIRFHYNTFPQIPVYLLSVSPLPLYFLALTFPFLLFFLLLLSCARQNFSKDSISSWSRPSSFHIFSTTLSHLIPARLLLFLPCMPISYGGVGGGGSRANAAYARKIAYMLRE